MIWRITKSTAARLWFVSKLKDILFCLKIAMSKHVANAFLRELTSMTWTAMGTPLEPGMRSPFEDALKKMATPRRYIIIAARYEWQGQLKEALAKELNDARLITAELITGRACRWQGEQRSGPQDQLTSSPLYNSVLDRYFPSLRLFLFILQK